MRITKEMKAGIIRAALKFKFKAVEESIEVARVALADEVYAHFHGADEAQARTMPKGWIAYCNSIQIQCEGYSWNWTHSQTNERRSDVINRTLRMSRDRPFPAHDRKYEIASDHPLWSQAWAIVKKHRKMMDDRAELQQKLQALLASCTTYKQLRAAWPEGERFFPTEITHSTALVPVGLSDQINKALGIPPIESVATSAVRKAASTSK